MPEPDENLEDELSGLANVHSDAMSEKIGSSLPVHLSVPIIGEREPAKLDSSNPLCPRPDDGLSSRRNSRPGFLLAALALFLAVLFGYRRVLMVLLYVPIYLTLFFLMVIAFNIALPYWIEKQNLKNPPAPISSIAQCQKLLYDRLSFSTPAAYSAAVIKKTWETQAEWRKQPLHPSLDVKTSTALDRLIAKIMRDFVWKWYDNLVPPPYTNLAATDSQQGFFLTQCETYASPAFPLAVEKSIRHSLRMVFNRLAKVDLPNLVVYKILPILTTHVEAFRQAESQAHARRSRNESRNGLFFSTGNDEIDLLIARRHADVLQRMNQEADSASGPSRPDERARPTIRMHPAVDVPAPNSQSSEQAHLRKLLEKLLPLILPAPEAKSPAVRILIAELLTCSIIGPIIEILSDSDFWNKLIEERAGNVIREQRMVEQLREVLDRQLSFGTASSKQIPIQTRSADIPNTRPRAASANQADIKNGIGPVPRLTSLDYPSALNGSLTATESISIKSTSKDFERFSRSIQRCDTLFDVRRLKNDVDTQIRKTEAALSSQFSPDQPTHKNQSSAQFHETAVSKPSSDTQKELTKFLDRLQSVRDIVDHRIAELGGASGPVDQSRAYDHHRASISTSKNFKQSHMILQPLQPIRTPSQLLQAILRDRESPALSYFTEFMDRRQRVNVVQFWLSVEGLKNPLEEELFPGAHSTSPKVQSRSLPPCKSYPSSIQDAVIEDLTAERDWEPMKADIAAIAEVNFATTEATNSLGLRRDDVLPLLKFLSIGLPSEYESSFPLQNASKSKSPSLITSVKEARAALFSMQHQVFDLMLAQDFPAFAAAGDLYLRATASLSLAKQPTSHVGSSTGLADVEPHVINSNPSSSFRGRFAFSPTNQINSNNQAQPPNSSQFRHGSPQRNDPASKTSRPLPSTRANSEDRSACLVGSKRITHSHAFSTSDLSLSLASKIPDKSTWTPKKPSNLPSSVLHSVLRSGDGKKVVRRIVPTPVPPQVTLQAAFDQRLPSERLTGPTKYNQLIRNQMVSLSKSVPPSSTNPTRLLSRSKAEQLSNQSRFQVSSSLDFLMSPFEGDRAPLFEDDSNVPTMNVTPFRSYSAQLSSKSNPEATVISHKVKPLERTLSDNSQAPAPSRRFKAMTLLDLEPSMSSDAAIALQEALTSIISTSDQSPDVSPIRLPHQGTHDLNESQGQLVSSHSSVVESSISKAVQSSPDNGKTMSLVDLKPLSVSSPHSLMKPIQRKGLFDDDDDDEDEDDDELKMFKSENQIVQHPSSFTPSSQNGRNSSKRASLSPPATQENRLQSSLSVSNVSDADERIMKLENELNLLSSLMRRAELTGNKLEIRLVRKSIESVSRELSEVMYIKTRMIEQREMALGGFRGKLVPGRVRIAITGTTTGQLSGEQSLSRTHSFGPPQPKISAIHLPKSHVTGAAAGLIMGSSMQEFILYTIEVHKLTEEDGSFGSGWIVTRRYSEFSKLHQVLKDRYPISRQLDFPAKGFGLGIGVGLGSANARGLVEQRKRALERYLKALIQIPVLCESPELARFLSRSKANLPVVGVDSATSLQRQIELFSGSGFVKAIYKSITSGGMDVPEEEIRGPGSALSTQSMLESLVGGFKQQAAEFASGISGFPATVQSAYEGTKASQVSKTFSIALDREQIGGDENLQVMGASKGANEEAYDTDQLAALTNNVRPIEGELVTSFTAPICDLLIEIFELNDKNQWLRKQGIVIVLQQILGGTIERKLKEAVSESLGDEHLAQLVGTLEEALWLPESEGGGLRARPKPRTFEEKIDTRDGAYRKLSAIIPDLAASVLGRSNARMATRRLFSMCQNRRLNKHLIYTIIDEVIGNLFPEVTI